MPPLERSWPELKYPSYRNRSVFSSEDWLTDKRTDDGAEGLWRIHDKLYDLHEFIDKHPGGAQWLELTKDTDCTELFESHHLTSKAEKILTQYFVRPAATLRNSPYTFHEDGFYKKLKGRVRKTLANLPQETIKAQTKIFMDVIVFITLLFVVLAAYWQSYKTATLAGALLGFLATCAHNYFHQKDNWRMYYFNLSLMSLRDWRISHVLSHHPYTNSLQDLDLSSSEPIFNFFPDPQKNVGHRYVTWVFWPILHGTQSHAEFLLRLSNNTSVWSDTVALIIPALLLVSGGDVFSVFWMWNWIIFVGSFVFDANDLIASHRHKTFLEGDAPRLDRDWGIAQIDATKDSHQGFGLSPFNMMAFGDHTLHHLFPAVDHNLLHYLYPVLIETCKEFNIKFELENSFYFLIAPFPQLANNKPKQIPPQ